MNNAYRQLTHISLLILGLAFLNIASAQEMVIESANPPDAEQGSSNKPVDIIGSGFDGTVIDVRFILHCNKKNCPDTGDIVVNNFEVDSETLIKTDISVLLEAPIADYDITVTSSRGRGGKGTTYKGVNKFSVKIRPTATLVPCDEFAPGGTCNCRFVTSDNNTIHSMQYNCQTSETLVIPNQIRAGGTAGIKTLTAVNCNTSLDGTTTSTGATYVCPEEGFNGSSVFANATHNGMVNYMNIEFASDVSRGCDQATDDIQSAISFVLDTEGPDGEPFPDPRSEERPTSFLQVWNTTIDSSFDPLCNAIEIIRTPEYTDLFVDPTDELPAVDWKVNVENSWIKSDSYVETGILYQGILKWGENISNEPRTSGNIIGAPACENPDAAIAVLHGPTFNLDPGFQVESLVENNTISMENTCNGPAESFGTAVLMIGEPGGYQTTAAINSNDISGAFIGVLVDGTINKVNFKANMLTGDNDAASGDIGICSNLPIGTKGKPNSIQDYTDAIIVGICPPE